MQKVSCFKWQNSLHFLNLRSKDWCKNVEHAKIIVILWWLSGLFIGQSKKVMGVDLIEVYGHSTFFRHGSVQNVSNI